ncbi:MAG: hypothetical protein HKM89_00715 [Gemmatimonadales bacterium]|nr:hypothetical protein [Gemmatimonadales bacterium]
MSSRGRLALRSTRAILSLGILGLLAYSLRGMDWRALLAALPANPLFYLLFVLFYLWLPLTEIVAYRVIWPLNTWKSLPVFIKKRIYNREVFQYSGEIYFFTWARKQVDRPSGNIARDIRDQNIVSSVASTLVALVLVAVFVHLGQKGLADLIGRQDISIVIGAAVVTVGLIALMAWFRKHIFAMAPRTALLVLGIHIGRFVFEQVLQIGMWAVALPEVPLRVWCTYAALSLIVSRIPLMTNRDLLFASISITLAAGMGTPVEVLAALMLVVAGLGKVLTMLCYAGFGLGKRPPDGRAARRAGRKSAYGRCPQDWQALRTGCIVSDPPLAG